MRALGPYRALLVVASCLLAALTVAPAAHADRLGPPWVARITVDQTTLHEEPSLESSPVGTLPRNALVIVVGENAEWTRVTDGWIRSTELVENVHPWIAEVSAPRTPVYNKPYTAGGVRRSAERGDLFRVMGVAPGAEGSGGLWWATTEGYIAIDALRESTGAWAEKWTLPAATDALQGWWAQVSGARVRVGPSTEAPIVGQIGGGRVKVIAEEQGEAVDGDSTWYRIDGGRYAGAYLHSSLAKRLPEPEPTFAPPPVDVGNGPWIVVNRSRYTLTLMRADEPVFTTYVSIGRAGKETPRGVYSTWGKHRAERMTSRFNRESPAPYDFPNVPFIQYYRDGGYAIHGTYWHDAFGTNESQGCINLSWSDAAYLFNQTLPRPVSGAGDRWWAGDPDKPTPVVILG